MHNTLRYKRIVVKIGSNVLTRDNGTPDTPAYRPLSTRSPHCTPRAPR